MADRTLNDIKYVNAGSRVWALQQVWSAFQDACRSNGRYWEGNA